MSPTIKVATEWLRKRMSRTTTAATIQEYVKSAAATPVPKPAVNVDHPPAVPELPPVPAAVQASINSFLHLGVRRKSHYKLKGCRHMLGSEDERIAMFDTVSKVRPDGMRKVAAGGGAYIIQVPGLKHGEQVGSVGTTMHTEHISANRLAGALELCHRMQAQCATER